MSKSNGKKKRPVGRPRSITGEKKEKLLEYLSLGMSRKMAGKALGFSHTTIADEAKRNPEFSAQLDQAEGKGVAENLDTIKKASRSDWKAAAWMLERKYPEEYGRTTKHAMTDSHGRDLTPMERQKLAESIIAERKGLEVANDS